MCIKIKSIITITVLILIFTFLIINPLQAEDLKERMELIEASQKIAVEMKPDYFQDRLGVLFTNYGTIEKEVNAGLKTRKHISVYNDDEIIVQSELIYLQQQETLSGFISVIIDPLPPDIPYVGLGREITGKNINQFFWGLNLTKNLFMELKILFPKGEGQFYLSTGIQFNL